MQHNIPLTHRQNSRGISRAPVYKYCCHRAAENAHGRRRIMVEQVQDHFVVVSTNDAPLRTCGRLKAPRRSFVDVDVYDRRGHSRTFSVKRYRNQLRAGLQRNRPPFFRRDHLLSCFIDFMKDNISQLIERTIYRYNFSLLYFSENENSL